MFQKKKLIGLVVFLGLAIGVASIVVVSFFLIETRTIAHPLSVAGRSYFEREQAFVLDRILRAEFSRYVEAEDKYASENGFSVKWDYGEREERSSGLRVYPGDFYVEKFHCIAIDYEETLFSKNWGVQRIYIQSALRFFKMLNDIEEALLVVDIGEKMDLEKTLARGDSSELVSTFDQFLFYELLDEPDNTWRRRFIRAELSRFVESENRYALKNGLSVKLSYNGGDSGGVRCHDFFIDYEEGSFFENRDAQRVYVETLRRFLRMLRNIDTKMKTDDFYWHFPNAERDLEEKIGGDVDRWYWKRTQKIHHYPDDFLDSSLYNNDNYEEERAFTTLRMFPPRFRKTKKP